MRRWSVAVVSGLILLSGLLGAAIDPPPAPNTQRPGDEPMSPAEARASIRLPEGFRATLFAAEPDVRQPVAFTFDHRGRLWVVECYSYPEWKAHDRVLIFEDTDGDGVHDRRRVFWDRGRNLAGIEVGFGGVWLCSAPHLLFVPDRDGDDVPDGEPEILLDGWNVDRAHHNIVNGLAWGPDGWLYGLQGILAESLVGPPGTPDDARVAMNCGVWRYHPTARLFEVVAHGTTNPWGLDWNAVGEAFFTNCVIGHLFHLVPGARYQRMFGRDFNPHAYELIDAISDHYHWAGGHWTSSRGGEGAHGEAGGGHAHSGCMVYLGDNWPDELRGKLFTSNIHGRRLNQDALEPRGSGYVGRHDRDMMFVGDPWFRGITVKYGPDGGVYVSDWSDLGECHDADGVHRTSGRIYKVVYERGGARPRGTDAATVGLATADPMELVERQAHPNEWHVRHARRRLAELHAGGADLREARERLRGVLERAAEPIERLRALWALNAVGAADERLLLACLDDAAEHVRAWALRLLLDPANRAVHGATVGERGEMRRRIEDLARREPSPVVRLHIASIAQRIPSDARWPIVTALASHAGDADDHNLPLMIWYATEPLVMADLPRAMALAREARIPTVARFIIRRAAAEDAGLEAVMAFLRDTREPDHALFALEETMITLAGRARTHMPASWPETFDALVRLGSSAVRQRGESLAVVFGDRRILPQLRRVVTDRAAPLDERRRAFELLVQARDEGLRGVLPQLLDAPPELRGAAIRAMAVYGDERTPARLIDAMPQLTPPERQDVVATLSARPAYAAALLDALAAGRVARGDVSAYHIRQMLRFNDPAITQRVEAAWGRARAHSEDKARTIANYRSILTPAYLESADLANGRAVFDRLCAACHRLFDSGGAIGPDLTGSNRNNIDYVLENVIDPSATVGRDYQLSLFDMQDGLFVTGIVRAESDSAVTVQTQNETLVLPKEEIVERRESELSMMPEQLFEGLTNDEIRDLVAYLASPRQVGRKTVMSNE